MLTPVEPPTLRELFLAAAELTNEEARQAFLHRACPDPVLRERVVRLLAARVRQPSSLLDQAVAESEAWLPAEVCANRSVHTVGGEPSSASAAAPVAPERRHDESSDHIYGSQIGPYQIIEQLGQGGMGAVYLAEQTQPVRRRVALKIIKPGMDSQEVIARFEAERQALAVMDHPYIARVLDAGQTPLGRPYFVMELVQGAPITEYCADAKLQLLERLELFSKVCHGVRHAHQRGIIHRDLKPRNVLVARQDGSPVPKVIDFGVAKALDQRLTERTIHTHIQQMIGTPSYMSPEQADLGGLDIDTRTDVYSLGVLLYELVTGTPPFDIATLTSQGFDEMRRTIREERPQTPSRRIAQSVGRSTGAHRQSTLQALPPLPKSRYRELDWIILKALEKDRGRRYESVSALAQDVHRFLENEPVEASPPSMGYRLRKFASRNKGWLTAALLTTCLLLVATIISTGLAIRATEAEHQSQQATEDIRALLYASDTVLAAQDLRSNDARQARSRLARHIPDAGQTDLRGFEWYYLWQRQDLNGDIIADLGSAVYDIAISPTGDRFAAVGEDAIVRVFDLASHQQLFAFPTDQGETNGSAFSPDSQRLATAGDDGTVRIWDLAEQRQLTRIDAHDGLALRVAFSPDGKTVASCGEDTRVRVWSTADGASRGTLNAHRKKIGTMAISPSGIVAAGGMLSQVSLWDLRDRQPLRRQFETESIPDSVSGLAFSDDNDLAYCTVGGRLTITDLDRQAVTFHRRLANGIQCIDFDPSGKWIIVGDRAGHLQAIPFEDGFWQMEATRQWNGHEGRVYSVKVTPDGRQVLSAGADGRVVSWNLYEHEQGQQIHFDKHCNNLVCIDKHRFAIGATDGIYVCNDDGRIEMDFGEIVGDWYVDYAEEASVLFAKSLTEVVAWNLSGATEVFRWSPKGSGRIRGFAVAGDGRTVILRVDKPSRDREIHVLDVSTRDVVNRWPVQSAKWIEISADGRWLAFDSNNEIQLVDLQRGEMLPPWPGHGSAICGLAFSADGESLTSVSDDRTVKLWSVPSGNLIDSTLAHRSSVGCVAMTSDARRIATWGDDHMLRFWTSKLQLVFEYPLHQGQTKVLAFSDDDQKLFCLCGERDIIILDGSRQ